RLRSPSFAASSMSGADGDDFASKLIERWRDESNVETRDLTSLTTTFMILGCAELVLPVREALIRRATADSQGWLAALELWHLRKYSDKQQGFPPGVNLPSLIQFANFSVA